MYRRLVVLVLLTLYFEPATAASPVIDCSLSVSSMDRFYTDLEGVWRCIECTYSYWDCLCALSQSSSSYLPAASLSNEPTYYSPLPTYEQSTPEDLNEVHAYLTSHTQLLVDGTVQRINENGTTVQPVTVQAHVDDIYTPGYRQPPVSPAESHCSSHRRQAPRKDGFICTAEGCNKAFDRACELNRHLKIHLGRSERPHKCTVCSEGFLYPKDLARHQRKHIKHASAKVTFHCQVYGCSNLEGFSRRDNLLRHHRRQHEGIASPSA